MPALLSGDPYIVVVKHSGDSLAVVVAVTVVVLPSGNPYIVVVKPIVIGGVIVDL